MLPQVLLRMYCIKLPAIFRCAGSTLPSTRVWHQYANSHISWDATEALVAVYAWHPQQWTAFQQLNIRITFVSDLQTIRSQLGTSYHGSISQISHRAGEARE